MKRENFCITYKCTTVYYVIVCSLSNLNASFPLMVLGSLLYIYTYIGVLYTQRQRTEENEVDDREVNFSVLQYLT